MRLQGKVAIITGSATGMGKATALAFAREGAKVVINYSRSEKEAKETLAEVKAVGTEAILVKADISKADEVQALVDRTMAEFGRIDILVNNAGFTRFIPLADLDAMTEDIWDRTLAVNVKGPWLCAKAVVPIMQQQKGGVIINNASNAGMRPTGSSIAYCASKAALIHLTRCLANTFGPYIRVNAIAPGYTLTRWHPNMTPELIEQRSKAVPLGRMGTPEDIARTALFLACESDFVIGQIIAVDGGKSV